MIEVTLILIGICMQILYIMAGYLLALLIGMALFFAAAMWCTKEWRKRHKQGAG